MISPASRAFIIVITCSFQYTKNNNYFTELMTCNILTYFAWLFLFSCYAAVKEDWWYTSFRDDLAISTSLPWHFSRVFCICWASNTSGRSTTPAWYLPWYSSCTWQPDIRASERYVFYNLQVCVCFILYWVIILFSLHLLNSRKIVLE